MRRTVAIMLAGAIAAVSVSTSAAAVEFQNTGVSLTFTPRIDPSPAPAAQSGHHLQGFGSFNIRTR